MQTVQRYRSWYKYLETRFYVNEKTNQLVPIIYEVSNMFSFNHNFKLKLVTKCERSILNKNEITRRNKLEEAR